METNPTVEPDAPLPPDEATPPAHSAENTPPEPVPAAAAEIAADAAAAEALPEPLAEVDVAAEQPPAPPADEIELEATAEGVSAEQVSDEQPPDKTGETRPSEMTPPESWPEETTIKAEEPSAEAVEENAPEIEAATPEATIPETEPASPEASTEAAAIIEAVPGATPQAAGEGETPAGEVAAEQAPEDPLVILADQAQTTRLSPTDEERAGTLLKEALLEGRTGVIRAIGALPKLPWVIGVNAVTNVWPEMKPAFRTQLLAGLVRTKGDAAKRIRLSLARGLFKQDIPIALKIAAGVSKEMREKETGGISPKHAQIFANVFIGRAKPWVSQLPLGEMKPSDADTLVHCALLAALTLPHAPITQLGVIKWAAENGRLVKAHQTVIDAAHKSLGRWSSKWQSALRKEVADLPETFASALKAPPKKVETPDAESAPAPAAEVEEPTSTLEESTDETASMEPDGESEAAEVAAEAHPSTDEDPDAEPAEVARSEEAAADKTTGEGFAETQVKQRPVYESKTVPRKPQQGQPAQGPQQQPQPQPQQQQQGGKGGQALKDASVPDLLRQLESQFQSLRSEVHATQSKLRQREEELRRAQKKANERTSAPVIEGEPTPEELARLNRQLEARNEELQARIEELLADSEARAVSVGAVSGEPVADPNTQLRTLLSLKLQEGYEDFLALEQESPDIVVQQHYRTVLRHVFHVLTQEGVQFTQVRQEGTLE